MKSAEGRKALSTSPGVLFLWLELYDNAARPRTAAALRQLVLRWYERSGRDLPWRRTDDPYAVLVSEMMLQQTQVGRVLPAYAAFLERFPTLRALSRASLGDVLRQWSGLGYNRRARDLHRIARAGPLPRTAEELDLLPGVGKYTAAAVACFAHGDPVAFADTNIRRVLGRVALGRSATEREARALDARLAPRRDAARWHHALMDIGATICLKRRPRCTACPLVTQCRYRGAEEPVSRRQSPFAASDRRIRGAIVRALAREPRTMRSLRAAISDERVPRLVAVLVREALVERAGAAYRLPV